MSKRWSTAYKIAKATGLAWSYGVPCDKALLRRMLSGKEDLRTAELGELRGVENESEAHLSYKLHLASLPTEWCLGGTPPSLYHESGHGTVQWSVTSKCTSVTINVCDWDGKLRPALKVAIPHWATAIVVKEHRYRKRVVIIHEGGGSTPATETLSAGDRHWGLLEEILIGLGFDCSSLRATHKATRSAVQ